MSWSVVPPEERLVERTDLRPIHRHNLNHIKRRTLQSHKVNSSCRRFLSLMLSSRSIRCRDVKHHHHLYARCTSSVIYHVRVVCFCYFSWASSLTQFSLKSWTDCESQSESTCLDSAVIKFSSKCRDVTNAASLQGGQLKSEELVRLDIQELIT